MLDKRFIDELRGRLVLSDIIGRRIKLTRAGHEYKACCPFHGEKSPSFYVNDGKGFYHCFGCGAHGDAVSFRMQHDNLGFMEAVESLAAEAGMEIPKPDPQAAEKYDEMDRLRQIMERATQWFEKQLRAPQNKFALDYLKQRGLTDDTIAQFRLGYAPNNWDALREAMLVEGLQVKDLEVLGILKQSSRPDKSDKPYAFFRGRVIFPVTDIRARVIAFGGRHLDAAFAGQDLKEKPPKYLNSAENPLFNKGAVLYGLARARPQLGPDKPLILVEGYMDVIALAQAGFTTAVAPLGTALTEEHMQLAWKVSIGDATPYLSFDGDAAGQNAAYRALERLMPFFTARHSVRVVFMPKGEDPDSLIRQKGPEAVQTLLSQALGVFDTLWQRDVQAAPATPEGRAALQARLDAAISQIGDPLLQQTYRQTLRDRLFHLGRSAAKPAFTPGALRKQFGKFNAKPQLLSTRQLALPAGNLENNRWKVLLLASINHAFLLEQHTEDLGMVTISDPDLETLREALVTLMHQRHSPEPLTSLEIKQFLSERGLDGIVANLLHDPVMQLFGFARPEAMADVALTGWKDIWMRLQHKNMHDDKSKLLHQMKTDFNDELADRLLALSQQQQTNLDDTP